jgi:glutathione-regulated potassium-efflux system ancillary protein KefG
MPQQPVDPADLIDAAGVAQVLGLANRTSVSIYQRRYRTMPSPVVDLGRGRTKLWSKTAVDAWARSADLRTPQEIASFELAQLELHGEAFAQGVFRAVYASARQHALGGGRKPREVGRTRRAAYDLAFADARQRDPDFWVDLPSGWLVAPSQSTEE